MPASSACGKRLQAGRTCCYSEYWSVLCIVHWLACRLLILHTFMNHAVAAFVKEKKKKNLLPFLLLNEANLKAQCIFDTKQVKDFKTQNA